MRHHLDPQRTRTSMSMAPGPAPTRADDADPSYAPPRVLGFSVADIDFDRLRRVVTASMSVDDLRTRPLLWQDEADQA